MSQPIKSRKKAQLWITQHGGGAVKGQPKEGRGKPTRNWGIVNPNLLEIPDGEAWLLKARNGDTLRVLFPLTVPPPGTVAAPEDEAEVTQEDIMKQLRDMQKVQRTIGESLKTVAQLQKDDLDRRQQQSLDDERIDKTQAEVIKQTSLHRLAERFLGQVMTYMIAKRQDLPPEDQAFLEKCLEAKSNLKSGATMREILGSLGFIQDAPALAERKAG